MAFEDYKIKQSVVVVYTGNGKGKTSAGLGLLGRALGNGHRVAFIQFIKYWDVGEHHFLHALEPVFGDALTFYKGGKGFFDAGSLSAKNVSGQDHKTAAEHTYQFTLACLQSGNYDLVICDEINNAVHDGLLSQSKLDYLITKRGKNTSLCLTGRNFPKNLLEKVDIATNMTKLKHHFDDKFLANEGIDY